MTTMTPLAEQAPPHISEAPQESKEPTLNPSVTEAMHNVWNEAMANGLPTPTGAELARATGGSASLGRRNAARWKQEQREANLPRRAKKESPAKTPTESSSKAPDRASKAPSRDVWIDVGIVVVALAAAVSSWAGWVGLAELSGWKQRLDIPMNDDIDLTLRLAWLLPLAVDVYAMVAARIWMRLPWISKRTRMFAMVSTLVTIGLGVIANALFHLFTIGGVETGQWLVVIGVAALPPLMLGAVAHLTALMNLDRDTSKGD